MERTQRLAGVGITGALRTTPTRALDTILNLPPIDLAIKNTAKIALLRLKAASLLQVSSYGHSRLGGTLTSFTDYLLPTRVFDRNFKVTIPERHFWELRTGDPGNSVNIYTDGSKTDKGVGAAVYCEELNIRSSYRLPNVCSIFQAETVAIQKAAEVAHGHVPRGITINIYVDSQAVIKALASNELKSKTLLNCYRALQTLGTNRRVLICWVPAHVGIWGNEAADKLAKEGADLNAQMAEHIPTPIQTMKKAIYDQTMNLARRRWAETTSCKITKTMWKAHNPNKTNFLLRLSRTQCRTVVGIYTGHALTGEHALRIGIISSDQCRHCKETGVKETVEHLLCHCPALSRTRYKYLGIYTLMNLEEASNLGMRSILNFAMATGAFGLDRGSAAEGLRDTS